MRPALVLTLLGVLFVVCPDPTNGAVSINPVMETCVNMYNPGPCPGDYKAGDAWFLDQCRKATCQENFYEIASCGVVHIAHDPTTCYLQYNKTLVYPACCMPALVCAGDKGFDEINLVG